jgi:hypothetical protein
MNHLKQRNYYYYYYYYYYYINRQAPAHEIA